MGDKERMRRIGLVGCVKRKAGGPEAAKALYVSTLFSGRRSFVERTCDEWWILSAEHGLVHPDDVLKPYDVTLKTASQAARRQWSARVLTAIDQGSLHQRYENTRQRRRLSMPAGA